MKYFRRCTISILILSICYISTIYADINVIWREFNDVQIDTTNIEFVKDGDKVSDPDERRELPFTPFASFIGDGYIVYLRHSSQVEADSTVPYGPVYSVMRHDNIGLYDIKKKTSWEHDFGDNIPFKAFQKDSLYYLVSTIGRNYNTIVFDPFKGETKRTFNCGKKGKDQEFTLSQTGRSGNRIVSFTLDKKYEVFEPEKVDEFLKIGDNRHAEGIVSGKEFSIFIEGKQISISKNSSDNSFIVDKPGLQLETGTVFDGNILLFLLSIDEKTLKNERIGLAISQSGTVTAFSINTMFSNSYYYSNGVLSILQAYRDINRILVVRYPSFGELFD